MKELLIGLTIGMIAGALITESSTSARSLVKKGKKALAKQFDSISEKI